MQLLMFFTTVGDDGAEWYVCTLNAWWYWMPVKALGKLLDEEVQLSFGIAQLPVAVFRMLTEEGMDMVHVRANERCGIVMCTSEP